MNRPAQTYNTDFYLPLQIARLQKSANNQQKKIAAWFQEHPYRSIGPTYLHQQFFPDFPDRRGGWEINSTRRTITNLTDSVRKDGIIYPPLLMMLDETNKSLLGGTEHKWRWRRREDFEGGPKQMEAFDFGNGAYSR